MQRRYGDYAAMFLKLLKDSADEVWDIYNVFQKDSPADEVLAKYKVCVSLLRICKYLDHGLVQTLRTNNL